MFLFSIIIRFGWQREDFSWSLVYLLTPEISFLVNKLFLRL